jgi:hypothetical protein
MFSTRERASRGLLAWTVQSEPSWPGVHRLEHVEGFGAADFADDDAVRAHAERVAQQVALLDGVLARHVGRARFHADDVALLEQELERVLDGDDALRARDVGRERVQEGRLTGTGTAGDEDVEPVGGASAEELGHARVERMDADEILHPVAVLAELADGDRGVLGRRRRDGDVDAGAVLEAGVDHRRHLVHASPDARQDALGDAAHMVFVAEPDVAQVDDAVALVVDRVIAVDHDFRDRLVVDERLNGPQAQHLVGHERDHALPDLAIDRVVARDEQREGGLFDQLAGLLGIGLAELVGVQRLDHGLMEIPDDVVQVRARGRLQHLLRGVCHEGREAGVGLLRHGESLLAGGELVRGVAVGAA